MSLPRTMTRLFATFLALCACEADAELCVVSGEGVWASICDFGGGLTTSCDCDDSDSFRIEGTFTIPAGAVVLQDGSAGGRVEVAAGGTLQILGGGVLGVGDGGLICHAGSACSFLGDYRSPSSAQSHPDPSSAGPWTISQVVLCPTAAGDEGCGTTGDPAIVRLETAAAPASIAELQAQVGALGPSLSGDVIWFWNSRASDPREGADTQFAYDLVDVPGPGSLDFSVRQGTLDQDGYPFARRELARFVTSAPVATGGRIVQLPNGSIPRDGYYDGRMLRWEGQTDTTRIYATLAGTSACPMPPGPCDVLKVVAREGFDASHTAGEAVFIEYGWDVGDEFFVLRPARVIRTSPAEKSARVDLMGEVEIRGAVFDRVGRLRIASEPSTCRELWLRDVTNSNGNGFEIAAGIQCEGVQLTGGSELPTPDCASGDRHDCTHGVVVLADSPVSLSRVAIRHTGDDAIVMGIGAVSLTLDRVRVQFASEHINQSQQCLAGGLAYDEIVHVTDLECLDAARSGPVLNPDHGTAAFTIDGLMAIGNKHGLSSENRNSDGNAQVAGTWLRNVTVLGSQMQSAAGNAIPAQAENFVVRLTEAATGQIFNGAPGIVRNGIVTQNEHGHAIVIDSRWKDWTIEMENIAWWGNSGSGNPILVVDEPASATFRRVLFSHFDNHDDPYEEFLRIRSEPEIDDLGGFTLEGVAFAHGQGSSMLSNQDPDAQLADMQLQQPCFWQNAQDASDPLALPPETLRGIDPLFVDPAAGRFDIDPSSPWNVAGCGVDSGAWAPGVRGFRRVHAWSHLTPELMATDDDGDGIPEDASAPACVGAALHGCRDNCPVAFNPDQSDVDDDGVGDACSPECRNGLDDDLDGFADFPDDRDCASADDPAELPEPSAILQLSLGTLLLGAARRRRAARRTRNASYTIARSRRALLSPN